MNFETLERVLHKEETVGFVKPTGDPEYLGWILIRKHKANNRILELIEPSDNPHIVAKEEQLQREPYMILCIELKRSVHEAGVYETQDDYRLMDRYRFSSLVEVERQLAEWGYSLADARYSRDIDAP